MACCFIDTPHYRVADQTMKLLHQSKLGQTMPLMNLLSLYEKNGQLGWGMLPATAAC